MKEIMRNKGRLLIDRDFYLDATDKMLAALWKDIFPIRIEFRFCTQQFEVDAVSELFDKVEQFEMPPFYQLTFEEKVVKRSGRRPSTTITRKIKRMK